MAYGRLRLHPAVQLLPPVIGSCSNLQSSTDISDGLALVKQLFRGAQLADDLLGVVAFNFHGASHGQFWPVGKLS